MCWYLVFKPCQLESLCDQIPAMMFTDQIYIEFQTRMSTQLVSDLRIIWDFFYLTGPNVTKSCVFHWIQSRVWYNSYDGYKKSLLFCQWFIFSSTININNSLSLMFLSWQGLSSGTRQRQNFLAKSKAETEILLLLLNLFNILQMVFWKYRIFHFPQITALIDIAIFKLRK